MEQQILSDVTFDTLGLEEVLLKGVKDAGFVHCTPIQARTLPLVLAGKDVEGQAQTGTGKSAAFLLGTMNWLLRHPRTDNGGNPRALIVAPTRELAVQIHKDAVVLGKYADLKIGVVFGGTGYEEQRQMLGRGLDVLIGTPGRLIDYFKQHIFNLNSISVVVVDEADRMFDLGFIKDIRYLLRRMPEPVERLNLLFSATLSHRVTELAYEHMNTPTIVDATDENVTVDGVVQAVYHVSKEEKVSLLLGLLKSMKVSRTIIFVNTKRVGEMLDAYLRVNGFDAGVLSGDVPQNKRLALLDRFTRGELKILVATDVAARGLHIPEVSHVFNFDLPQDAEDYVHRIGRTARVGATGDAVSLACEEFVYSLPEIQDYIGAPIPVLPVTEELMMTLTHPPRQPRRPPKKHTGGGNRNARPSKSGSAGSSRRR
jgi:ATP-dependent RNA helicase RhlB